MKSKVLFLSVLCFVLAASPVCADLYSDVPWPSWVGEPNSLWYVLGGGFEEHFGADPGGVDKPTWMPNFTNGADFIGTDVVFTVDNYDFPNPSKRFWFYFEYSNIPEFIDFSYSLGFDEQGYSVVSGGLRQSQVTNGQVEDIWEFRFEPNPDQEVFTVGYRFGFIPPLPPDDEFTAALNSIGMTFAIATQCVPVPGAVWLLGTGLLGLFAFRKKFR